jgi:primosomal protein N' (replication factor Y)
VESLHSRKAIRISEVASILDQRKTLPVINSLLEKGIILMEEELPQRYKPNRKLCPAYAKATTEQVSDRS